MLALAFIFVLHVLDFTPLICFGCCKVINSSQLGKGSFLAHLLSFSSVLGLQPAANCCDFRNQEKGGKKKYFLEN